MGTWGPALYSDDFAADVRGDFTDAARDGLSAAAIVDRLTQEHAASLADADEGSVFWLVVAEMGWRLGRLDERALEQALAVIDSDRDLARWAQPRDRGKRAAVLAKIRSQLLTPPPPPKRVAKRILDETTWEVGDVIAFRLRSGRQTLLRVIGHHEDTAGRSAVCELLDWFGEHVPAPKDIDRLGVRCQPGRYRRTQFLLQSPRRKADQARVTETGLRSTPAQSSGGYVVLVWPYVDRQLQEIFGVD